MTILIVATIAFLLLIWFESDVFAAYGSRIPFIKCFFSKYINKLEYQKKEPVPHFLNFLGYLKTEKKGFWVELVTCPICLSFWFAVLFSFLGKIQFIPVYAILGLFLYLLVTILLRNIEN